MAYCSDPAREKLMGYKLGGERENWLWRLRGWIVKKGISIMCPNSTLSANVAADIPLLRAGIRLAYLKALAALGISNFVARSGLGYNFVCHVEDLAAFPFYHAGAYRAELELASAWLQTVERPLAFDVGANDGFFACHLAQMMGQRGKIYAFEPVPETFAKLVHSVSRLGLTAQIITIPAAVLESSRLVQLSCPTGNSLQAQVISCLNQHAGHRLTEAHAIPLDTFRALDSGRPSLIKIDAEGSEPAVLRGAAHLLASSEPPVVLFEFNPVALTECGENVDTLAACLMGYILYYVDDLHGQRLPFGELIEDLRDISWSCNLFAVPGAEAAVRCWAAVSAQVQQRLATRHKNSFN